MAVTSAIQDRSFAEAMSGSIKDILCGDDGILLEVAIDWIAAELSPDDIFSEAQMKAWAEENGFVEGGEQ